MPASLRQPGLPSVDYYAPNYRIEVDGAELDPTTKGDVLQVQVTMQKDALTSYSLTVNNWDDQTLSFKYSDSDTLFIGSDVHIEMGYADQLVSMVRGPITSLAPKFPEAGALTMAVGGTDSMQRFKGSRPQAGDRLIFVDKADWQIATEVADRNGLPIEVTREGPTHDRVVQEKDQDDARFLLDRARRIDFDVHVRIHPDTNQETLFFVKPTDGRDGRAIRLFEFEWGKSLIQFTPKLSANKQVSSVTVRGWNPATKEPIEYTATADDLPATPGNGTNGPQAASRLTTRSGGKQDFIIDAGVISEDEARQLAISRLTQRAYSFNTGSGSVIGQPQLQPGDNVSLRGLGTRFSGQYRVTKVDHVIGTKGYRTQFDVERLRDGGTS